MDKPKLLIYSDSHVLGGADRYLLSIVPALKTDWQITYIYREDVDFKQLVKEMENLGVRCLKSAEPKLGFKSFNNLKKLFKKEEPSLIVFNQGSFYTSKMARLTASIMKIPHIIIQHGSTYEGKKFYSIANRIFARLTFPAALAMIVPSKSSEKFFEERFKYLENIKVLNHGIDLTKFDAKKFNRDNIRKKLNIPPNDIVLIFIGRLEEDKGPDLALEVFSKLDNTNCHLLILGEGSQRKDLVSQAKRIGLNRIHFMGQTQGTAEYLAASDILIQSSRSESFSLAVVEAMAMGVVPVAFKVDSLPAMIGNNSLVAPYSDIDAMKNIVSNIIAEPKHRAELSKFVQARAQKLFDIKRMQTETGKFFQEILKKLSN